MVLVYIHLLGSLITLGFAIYNIKTDSKLKDQYRDDPIPVLIGTGVMMLLWFVIAPFVLIKYLIDWIIKDD